MTVKQSRRQAYRKLAAAAGALSAFSLAGCSDANPDPASGPNEQFETTHVGVDTTAMGRAGEEDAIPAERSPARGETPEFECDGEAVNLEVERDNLKNHLEELEYELRPFRTGARATEYLLDQLESGFPDQTFQRGKSVGLTARSGVVTLEILQDGFSTGHATAWFVDEEHLFTNAHNVYPSGPDSEFRGVTQDGDQFEVEVVDVVEEMIPDVALLRTRYPGATPLPMTGVADLEAGQPLVQVGHPSEIGFWIISMGRFVGAQPSHTIDGDEYMALKSIVPGRPGVSGSPLLTLDGEVVGMTHGGEPVSPFRDLGTPPPVAPDVVFDGPIGDVTVSMHDGSDILAQLLEEWR